jgi:MYXO-CTERM domain-containing protein
MSLLRLLVATGLLVVGVQQALADGEATNPDFASPGFAATSASAVGHTVPTVTTGAASAGTDSIGISGSVSSSGDSEVTARGFVYNTTGNPSLDSGTAVAAGSGSGLFMASLTGLAEDTTYQIRTYATNAAGTAYGSELSVTTAAVLKATIVRDAAASTMVVPVISNRSTVIYSSTAPTFSGTAEAGATVAISVDGVSAGTATAGTDGAWTYTLSAALDVGVHTIVATATATDGRTSSTTLVQSSIAPTGYAATATGGSSGTDVVATTAEQFINYATSSSVYVITVSGQLSVGTVAVAANKTIQGADANAGIEGCLNLSASGNIIICGLNLSNPAGHAIQITNTMRVYVTHCTFLDCAAEQVAISYSDMLTFSWCEFAATRAGQAVMKLGLENSTVDTPRLTLHHNWWSNNLASALPAAASGYVHQFSNYVNTPGNTSGTALSGAAQLLSEGNHFNGVANPLTKAGTATIYSSNNTYTSCTGTTAAGSDAVFTPGYSYEMQAPAEVATVVPALAGNTAGRLYDNPDVGTATITATATTVEAGASTTLTAVPSGVTASTYQWRLANVPLSGATSSTYTISSMSSSTAGKYTVAIGLADGSTVVAVPVTLTLSTSTSDDDDDDDDSGGGGDCGLLFPAMIALLAFRRRRD